MPLDNISSQYMTITIIGNRGIELKKLNEQDRLGMYEESKMGNDDIREE